MRNDQVQAVDTGVDAEEEVAVVWQVVDRNVGDLREISLGLGLHLEIAAVQHVTSSETKSVKEVLFTE